jgi:predicted AlkP superfamily pyrophosphatase or phosphodiesterase
VRRLRLRLACALLLALASTFVVCLARAVDAQVARRPIVILVSIDGWRWDYVSRFSPPTLTGLAARGVTAEGLVPVFPSKTFPNHYTIVTGLYPHRHGIVSNNMRDRALPGTFTLSNHTVQQDTRWWGGVPLWVSVERQGGIAATMFWPGSDREIAGDRPALWRPFDESVSNDARVNQILSWLRLPEPERPTFMTLYFDEVDTVSHDAGPDTPPMRVAALSVDAAIGRLVAGINSAKLESRVNLVVVSDHGMAPTSRDRVIYLDDYVDLATIEVIDWSPILGVSPLDGSVDALYAALRGKHAALQVFKSAELPASYRLAGHPRYPPLIGIADDGWTITSRARAARSLDEPGGNHGYDPVHRSMHGLFVAAGPSFRAGVKSPRFENVHVYELLCRVLGVRPEPNDGDPEITASFVNDRRTP